MSDTKAIGFEDAIESAADRCGWSEKTQKNVMLDFLVFAGQFDSNLLDVFDRYCQNRVIDEFAMAEEEDEEDDLDDDDEDDSDLEDDEEEDEFDEDDDDSDLDDDDDEEEDDSDVE